MENSAEVFEGGSSDEENFYDGSGGGYDFEKIRPCSLRLLGLISIVLVAGALLVVAMRGSEPMVDVADLSAQQLLIYEMDMMHFTPASSSRSQILQAMDRLEGLQTDYGVTTVWVLPPYERYDRAPLTSAPYASINYYSIEPSLGTEDDMRQFVSKAHQLGLRVIFDITTMGHGCKDLGPTSTEERRDGLPEEDKSDKITLNIPVTNPFNDLCVYNWNYQDDGGKSITDFFTRIFQHWVKTLDIDGYRCDTADMWADPNWQQNTKLGISDDRKKEIREYFWSTIIREVRALKPEAYFLAEVADPTFWSYGFDTVYAAMLQQGWGGTYMVDAVRGNSYGALKTELQQLGSQQDSHTYLYFVTNHDMWAYGVNGKFDGAKNPIDMYGGAGGVKRALLISVFASMGTVSIYNGQEQGTSQYLNFNNADHSYDINPTDFDIGIRTVHQCAGQIFNSNGRLFTNGTTEYCSLDSSFAIIRTLGSAKIAVFFGPECLQEFQAQVPLLLWEEAPGTHAIEIRATLGVQSASGCMETPRAQIHT